MSSKRGGLGKGLEALIPHGKDVFTDKSEFSLDKEQIANETSAVRQIPLEKIRPNPRQPRTVFTEREISELADSIREHGIIQPLIITHGVVEDEFVLIAGERRLQAARQANLKTVPAIFREASEQDLIELALIENVQRADLTPLETAEAYRQLAEDFNLSHEEIAVRVGKSRVSITNTLRLLRLPTLVQQTLAEGKITEGHARVLLALSSPQAQTAALNTILTKELNVRQTEELVRKLSGQRHHPPSKSEDLHHTPEILDLQEKLRTRLSTKVDIQRGKRGGTITIYYYSDEEFNSLLDLILE